MRQDAPTKAPVTTSSLIPGSSDASASNVVAQWTKMIHVATDRLKMTSLSLPLLEMQSAPGKASLPPVGFGI
jgi:hypothetical protein